MQTLQVQSKNHSTLYLVNVMILKFVDTHHTLKPRTYLVKGIMYVKRKYVNVVSL